MLSAVIRADHRYPALQLAPQPGHERIVRPGPLVLGSAPLNHPTPTTDTDRTVSRRSEPSSCTTLTGDKPVIPSVPFIRCAIARPRGTTGSLRPTFVPARPVGLAVRQAYAVTLCKREYRPR